MNSQLRLKLIRCDLLEVAETPRKPALKLLGHGLDAIIQRTRPRGMLGCGPRTKIPPEITADVRLERYRMAAVLFPLFRDDHAARMRAYVGELRKQRWQLGDFSRAGSARLQLSMRGLVAEQQGRR